MSQHLLFLLLGLANGAVIASLALALVVTYRSSGVVNFATGAMALLTAYFFGFLRDGQVFVPFPGLPQTMDVGGPWPLAAALVVSLVFGGALGLAVYVLVFRPLRNAPPVARAVASVGVMIVITGVILERVGTAPRVVQPIFPSSPISVFGVRVTQDRIWFAATVLVVTALVSLLYQHTRFGLHTRAAAETEKGAYLSGISPDRVAALNWILSGVIAGGAGILIATILPLVPTAYALLIVPALAAAILGRFERVWPAVIGGLAVGMLQAEVTLLQSLWDWLPPNGVAELIPLALVLLALVVGKRALPGRGEVVRQHLGRAPRPIHLGRSTVAGLVLAVAGVLLLSGSWRIALVTSCIYGVISLSLVVVTGYAGQISLAQLTLAGAAGFALGPITTSLGVPFPIAPVLASLVAAAIGVVVGLPGLRVRGLPFAFVTLALAVFLEAAWFRNTDLVPVGGQRVADPTLFGLDLGPGIGTSFPRLPFSFMVLGVFVAVALATALLRRSQLGAAMLAVRADERAAAATGIDVGRTKLAAFAIASFIAGLGGSLLAYRQGSVTYETFSVLAGLAIFAATYVAGITSVSGGVLAGFLGAGGVVHLLLTRELSLGAEWYQVLTGLGLVLTVILEPEGLVGRAHGVMERARPARATTPVSQHPVDREDSASGPPATDTIVLEVRDLRVAYGGVDALDGVSLSVRQGEVVGIIGPNGAGKTTLVDALIGLTESTGRVELRGTSVDSMSPHQRVRAGMARTFQSISLWEGLSVRENVMAGLARGESRAVGEDRVAHWLSMLDLLEVEHRMVGALSQGQRQLVSIARALVTDPTVLLLDEPAAGLDSNESRWLADRLRDVRASGVTIVLIDHDMGLVLDVCDVVHVLDFGRRIASGTPSEIVKDRAVSRAYLGSVVAGVEGGG